MTERGTDVSDAALVDELRAGSSAGLTGLFDRYADAVYNYCFRRTAGWDRAEDATATVFLEVWRGRSRVLVHEGSALPWLYGIANNVCRNLERSRRRQHSALHRMLRDDVEPDPADGVVTRLDNEQRMAAVLAAVERLPRHEREVVALVAWSGLSYEATARALDVPLGTVRSRLSRARKRLALSVDDPSSQNPGDPDVRSDPTP